MSMISYKQRAPSFKKKLEILGKVDQDPKRKRAEIAKESGLAPSTPCTIVGQRELATKDVQRLSVKIKRAKRAQHVKLEEILLVWF